MKQRDLDGGLNPPRRNKKAQATSALCCITINKKAEAFNLGF